MGLGGMVRGKIWIVCVLACLVSSVSASGDRALLREVKQHLDLAKENALRGIASGALTHAAVVSPDRKIRIRVDCAEIRPSEQGPYRNALSGALALWENALGQKLFEVTYTGVADVTMHFKPNVANNGTDVCGHTAWARGIIGTGSQARAVLTADVQVRTFQPSGIPMTFDQVRACIAHELGHVLGLDDSASEGDIMAPMNLKRPAVSIRPEEIRSLVSAREEAAKIRTRFGFPK